MRTFFGIEGGGGNGGKTGDQEEWDGGGYRRKVGASESSRTQNGNARDYDRMEHRYACVDRKEGMVVRLGLDRIGLGWKILTGKKRRYAKFGTGKREEEFISR